MKKILTLFLATSMMAGCSCNKKSPNSDTTRAAYKTQALIQKFKPVIEGLWVNKAYINKILKTKSPQDAADAVGNITAMSIEIKGDSVEMGVNYGNHEGNTIKGKLKPGHRPSLLGFYNDNGTNDEFGYTIRNGDTTLFLYTPDEGKKQRVKTEYVKSLNSLSDVADKADHLDEVQYLINKGLIAGKYTATDSLGKNYNVTFTSGGKVSGLPNFKTYYIQDDFIGPESNLDEIIFDVYQKNSANYAFKINADTLSIFTTRESADSTELYYNTLVYKLVRIK